jgi:hypothetical protein
MSSLHLLIMNETRGNFSDSSDVRQIGHYESHGKSFRVANLQTLPAVQRVTMRFTFPKGLTRREGTVFRVFFPKAEA